MRLPTLIFISIALTGIFSLKKLSGKEAKDHFWNSIATAVKGYETNEALDRYNVPYQVYREKTVGNPHMINIQFKEQKDSTVLRFFKAKKDDVEKQLKAYDSDEIDIQAKAFPTFIQKMVQFNVDESEILYFNMIEDIKNVILNIKEEKKLHFKEDFKGETVVLQLFYVENMLGVFYIKSEKIDQQFVLKVRFVLSKQGKNEELEVVIPVFEIGNSVFQSKMDLIVNALNLKNYVNCNDDNASQFELFVKNKGIPLVSVIFDESKKGSSLRTFKLISTDDTALGTIAYIAPPNDKDLGSYRLTITMKDNKKINADFKRMTVAEFNQFLKSLKIGDQFSSLYDKLVVIFKDNVNDVFGKAKKEINFAHSLERRGLFSSINVLTAKSGNKFILAMKYIEDGANISVELDTQNPVLNTIILKFNRNAFDSSIIGISFNNQMLFVQDVLEKKSGVPMDRLSLILSMKSSFLLK